MGRYYPENLPDGVKAEIQETERHLKGKMDAWHTARSNFSETVVEGQLMRPLDEILQGWDARLQAFEAEEGDKSKAMDKMVALVRQRSEVIKAYIDQMTPADMRLTLETLARMEQYGQEFAKLLIDSTDPEKKKKYAWVENALRYVMGVPASGSSSADAKKDEIQDIAKHLVGEQVSQEQAGEPEPNFSYACTLLAFAKPEQRKEIVEKVLARKELEATAAKEGIPVLEAKKRLLKTLCDRGAVSPLEVEEALGKEAFSDPEMQAMADLWEEKYDYMKQAKYLAGESYGATNAANEMFTLSNILRVFGYVAGSATVLLNGIVNWKEIKEDPSYFFKIPQVWMGGAAIATSAVAGSDQTLGEMTASKDTIATWDGKKSRDALLSVVSASPRGWKKILEDNQYTGVRILAEFITQRCNDNGTLKEKEATAANFKEFLERQKRINPAKEAIYDSLLAQMNAIEKNERNPDVTATRFQKVANAFVKLNILGDNDQVAGIYQQSLDIAQGKSAPTTAATSPTP